MPGRGCSTARRARGSRAASPGPSPRRPPALPEGQVVGRAVDEVDHADAVERLDHAGVQGRAAQPQVGRAEGDVVAHRRHEQLVVRVLEDHADPAPDLQQVLLRDRETENLHRPAPAVRIPLRCRTRVVLPAPLGPSSATRSPWCTWRFAEQGLVAVGVGVGQPAHVGPGCSQRHRQGHRGQGEPGQYAGLCPLRRRRRRTVGHRHPAAVAARQHREVDALAALVGPDEQGAGSGREGRPARTEVAVKPGTRGRSACAPARRSPPRGSASQSP